MTDQIDNGQDTITQFSIPEEYAEKSWAKNFEGKSGDELQNEFFKSYDNAQTLISKRVEDYIGETDITKLANYDTLKEKFAPQVPEKIEDYALNDILKDENGELKYQFPDDVLTGFSEKFKELGVTKEQAQGILQYYTNFEMSKFSDATSPDNLENQKAELFKANPEQLKTCDNLISEFLPKEDIEFLQMYAPNQTLMMFYKLTKNFVEKYNYKESNAGAGQGSNSDFIGDVNSEYEKIVAELQQLANRPHSAEEKQRLLDRLNKLNLG